MEEGGGSRGVRSHFGSSARGASLRECACLSLSLVSVVVGRVDIVASQAAIKTTGFVIS